MAEDVSIEHLHPEIDGLLSRALEESSLERLGESLETAQRLLEVGNHAYCRDLIGYLLNRHGELDDDGLLEAIHDALEKLVEAAAPTKKRASPTVGQRAKSPKPLPGEARRSKGVSMGHSLSGLPKDPRMLAAGKGGGLFAGSAAPRVTEAATLEQGAGGQDDTPPSFPAVAPRRPPAAEARGPRPGPVSPSPPPPEAWQTAPAAPPAQLGDASRAGPFYPDGPRPAARGGPQPVNTLVHYEPAPLSHVAARPLVPVGSDARPGRLAFAFVSGCLVGALGVVVLLQQLAPEIWVDDGGAMTGRSVRPERPSIRRPAAVRVVEVTAPPPARLVLQPSVPLAAIEALPVAGPAVAAVAAKVAGAAPQPLRPAASPGAGNLVSAAVQPAIRRPAVARPAAAQSALPPALNEASAPLPRAPPAVAVEKTRRRTQARPRPAPRRRRERLPRAAPEAPHGTLVVQVAPGVSGTVEVYVDSKLSGRAPLRRKLAPGLHEVKTVERGGYPEIRVVRVEEGQTSQVVVAVPPARP